MIVNTSFDHIVILPVIIVDTVNLVVNVNREGNTVKALVAHAAPETARVVRLAHGLQDLYTNTPTH